MSVAEQARKPISVAQPRQSEERYDTPVDPVPPVKLTKAEEKEKYKGRHELRKSPEEVTKRKNRRRLAIAAAIMLALPALLNGSVAKNTAPNASPPSHSSPSGTLPDNRNPEQPKPPTNPRTLATTITVQPGDSEWNISQQSLRNATGEQPTMPMVNAITIMNAGINMKNGLASHPDDLAIGQELVVLDTDAVKLINDAATNPSTNPGLANKVKDLNSHTGPIEQVAKNEQATIIDIQNDLAEELTATPIYERVASDLNINPNNQPSLSFDAIWALPITSIPTSRPSIVDLEQSMGDAATESSIPSRQISRLRKNAEQVIFSREATTSKPNLTLIA